MAIPPPKMATFARTPKNHVNAASMRKPTGSRRG